MSDHLDLLMWLEQTYERDYSEVSEEDQGFSIQTIDNPGWLVKARLGQFSRQIVVADRSLVQVGDPPRAENGNVGGEVWMVCEIKSGEFIGAGDPTQLRAILTLFREFVEQDLH